MHTLRSSLLVSILLALAGCGGAAVKPDAAPARIPFDGDLYASAARESASGRDAEHFLRDGDPAERFAKRLTIAEFDASGGAKGVAQGVVQLARLRTPGLLPETFAAEGNEQHDISVSWVVLTDDNSAVEYHAARFVDLAPPRVREYHFIWRRYTNGADPDAVLGEMQPQIDSLLPRWVGRLNGLDRAPQR